MPGLGPGIHVFLPGRQDVDGRAKPGHDAATVTAEIGDPFRRWTICAAIAT